MLTNFQIFFTNRLSSKFMESDNEISHHTSNESLHYLVKCLCSKITMTQSWVKQTSMQDSWHWKQLLRNIHPMTLASFLFHDKKIFTETTLKTLQNDWLYAYPSTKKKDGAIKCLHTQLPFSHIRQHGRRVTSSWHYTSLALVDNGVKVTEEY